MAELDNPFEVDGCCIRVADRRWKFAETHADAIADYWQAAKSANPNLFNGTVFVIERWMAERGVLRGTALKVAFAEQLYWRAVEFAGGECEEAFATTIIRAACGGIFLARAVGGTMNEGRYLSPGGFLDANDVTVSGRLDIAGAAERELAEEVGLTTSVLKRRPGYLITHRWPFLAVASVYDATLKGDDLLAAVEAHLAGEGRPELEAPRMIRTRRELAALPVAWFARLLAEPFLE